MVRFLRQSPFLCLCVFINTLQLVECDKQFLLFVYTLCFLGEVYVSEKKFFINKERWGRKMRDNNIPLTEARYIYNTESVIKELKINYFAFGGYIFKIELFLLLEFLLWYILLTIQLDNYYYRKLNKLNNNVDFMTNKIFIKKLVGTLQINKKIAFIFIAFVNSPENRLFVLHITLFVYLNLNR